jgi:hypothetical protein
LAWWNFWTTQAQRIHRKSRVEQGKLTKAILEFRF